MKLRRVSLAVIIIALVIVAFLLFGSWKWGWGRGGSTEGKGDEAQEGKPAAPLAAKAPDKQPCAIRVDAKGIWVEETPRRLVDSTGAVAYCKLRGGPVTLKLIFDAPHGVVTQVEEAFAKSGLTVEVVRPGR